MKSSKCTAAQIIGILNEQESGSPRAEVCRKHGISSATVHKQLPLACHWFEPNGDARFGGMDVSKAQRLKVLEDENARLKKLLAEAVAHVVEVHRLSQRRACEVLAVDRSGIRYQSIRPDDAAERAAMKAVATERRRFGYPSASRRLPAIAERRRIQIMLDRQGIVMNLKKLRRLFGEGRLQLRKRGGRKRALGTRRPMVVPQAANER
jgi:Transposase